MRWLLPILLGQAAAMTQRIKVTPGGAIFQAVPDEDHAGLLHIVDLGREAESRPVRAQLN